MKCHKNIFERQQMDEHKQIKVFIFIDNNSSLLFLTNADSAKHLTREK